MKNYFERGATMPMMVLIVVVAAVVLGVLYFSVSNRPGEQAVMEKKGETMMKKEGDAMMADKTATTAEDAMMRRNDGAMMDKKDGVVMGDAMMQKYTGTVFAGKSAPLLDFNKADYDVALKTDKLIALYFYANWCPICKAEVASSLYPAFNELTNDKVIGFRVNYNDNQTDNDEKNIAREFGIAYQHTKVFVKNGERILKSPESWNKERYLSEINKY